MNNSKFWYRLIVVLCAIILLISGFFIGKLTIKNESALCLTNPFTYSVQAIEKINNANFTCSCNSIDKPINPFYFDDKGIYTKPFNLF